jgi:hypothetical protein
MAAQGHERRPRHSLAYGKVVRDLPIGPLDQARHRRNSDTGDQTTVTFPDIGRARLAYCGIGRPIDV